MREESDRRLRAAQEQLERLRQGLKNKPHPDVPPELVATTQAGIMELISEIEAEIAAIENQKLP